MAIIFEDHCDLQDPVILPYISDPIKQEGMVLWILVQSDTVNYLILFVGHGYLLFHGPVILPYISDPIK